MIARAAALIGSLLIVGLHSGCRIHRQTHEVEMKAELPRSRPLAEVAAAGSAEFELAPIFDEPAPSQSAVPARTAGCRTCVNVLDAEPYSRLDETVFSTHSPPPRPAVLASADLQFTNFQEPVPATVMPATYQPELVQVAAETPMPVAPAPVQQTPTVTAPTPVATPAPAPVSPAPLAIANTNALSPVTDTPAATTATQVMNTNRVAINYRVGRVGPSGLGRVEVWASNDQGQTWKKLNVDGQHSPMQIELPGDGVWGIRLTATNGNGFGGTPPRTGDQGSFTVEVDTAAPRVQLGNIDPNADSQAIHLRWNASDIGFGREPIALFYRVQNGDWTLIARTDNSGQYRWEYPRDKGSQFYFRVQATDRAGNTAHCDSPTAVALDVTVPNLVVVGVSGAGKQSSGN